MNILIKSYITPLIFLIVHFNSYSQTQTFFIKGAIVYVDDFKNVLNSNISVGDSIKGTIKYDLNIPDSQPWIEVGDYYNNSSSSGIRITINNYVFQTDSNNVNCLLETCNNIYNMDNIVFRSYNNIFNPQIVEFTETHIAWQLDDPTQTALSSTSIPTCINLSSWQQPFALTITGSRRFSSTVETTINAPVEKVWEVWTEPEHITKWNGPNEGWHTPKAQNDLRVGGKFLSRMEAKDGSMGFDFEGIYDEVKNNELIAYTIADGRKVKVIFKVLGPKTTVTETFEAEDVNSIELQQGGWQAILDNFKRYVES